MIRTENLSFSYVGNNSSWGLQDVCLDVAQGECIVICGASGCGKTTLTKALNGLIPHFEGVAGRPGSVEYWKCCQGYERYKTL